jgi:hypothetical protein
MKFLCLAYGSEEDWNALNESERQELLAQDEVIRRRGALMSAVKNDVTSVRNWNKNLVITGEPYVFRQLPLAGFSVIEARSLDEVIALVADTPCPRAKGVVEIYPFWDDMTGN